MRRTSHCLAASLALTLLWAAAPAERAWAMEPAVAIVLDGSGSMWGPIDGLRPNKLSLAREALRQGLGGVPPQARVGLVAFGHRRGDCGDVEIMRTPEPLDAERLMAPLAQINPRGRGPLTLALREAAKSLPREGAPRSLLLIHDDADNCQPDLCAAAAEFRSSGITVHVVGLGVKAEDMAKMACLPQLTGGRHLNAQSAEQVPGLVEQALRLAAGETEAAPAPRTAGLVPPAPIPATGPPALHLRALLAANAQPLNAPLVWVVAREDRAGVPLFEASATSPVVPVPPGRYVVEAYDGTVSARQQMEVRDNRPTAVTVVLNAGLAQIRALAQKSATPLAEAIITVSSAVTSTDCRKDTAGAPVAAFRAGEALAVLPPGRFLVRAQLGFVCGQKTVEVAVGRQVTVDIPLSGGRLELTTAAREGSSPLDAPVFTVMEDDPDAPSGKRELARSAARQAEFMLPPGTYFVVARQGGIEARDRLAIGPGELVRRTLVVPPAGRLSLATRGTGASHVIEPISYTVERIDGLAQDVVTTSHAAPTLLLAAGRYRVEGRSGLTNVRTVREVDIKGGQTHELVLVHQAASLKLRLAGPGASDVFWDIRDETGRAVWASGLAEPLATLQAGRYLVRAEAREKRYERNVELQVGDARLVEIAPD